MQTASLKGMKVVSREKLFLDDDECWTIEEILLAKDEDSEQDVEEPISQFSLPSQSPDGVSMSYDVPLDRSVFDKEEEDAVVEMFGLNSTDSAELEACCHFQCNRVLPQDMVLEHRRTFQEMSKQEQDLIILGQFQVFRRSRALEAHYGKMTKRRTSQCKNPNKIVRRDMAFMFYSFPICKKMYFFLHDLRETRYKNLCAHFDKSGIHPRKHKSQGKSTNRGNELTPEDINSVVTFIKSFADCGKKSTSKNYEVVKLSTTETKCSIHRQYCNAMESQPDRKVVARSTFSRIWKKYCPYVVLVKPSTDPHDSAKTTLPDKDGNIDLHDEVKKRSDVRTAA